MAAAADDAKLIHALNVLRRMPPSDVAKDLERLAALLPEEADDLREKVDQPLKTAVCTATGRPFLLCDYNRDGDSFRSPWSNTYQPAPEPSEDGEEPFVPTGSIRDLEVAANELFDTYRGLYYGASTGLSSVYMWDSGDGVAACWVLKKEIPEASGGRFVKSAAWDAVHVVDAQPTGKGSEWVYRLTTTVLLSLTVEREAVGHVRIAGSLNRQAEKKVAAPDHVATMGSMIEDMESDMRERMEALYIAKTKDAMNATHKRTTGPVQSEAFTSSLTAAVMAKGAERKSKGFD